MKTHLFVYKKVLKILKMPKTTATLDSRSSKTLPGSPAISYKLSEKRFIELGWTAHPNVLTTIPVVVMKAKFSHPVISPWFQLRLNTFKLHYPNGNLVCEAKPDGTGRIFYPGGRQAIKIEKGGINNHRTRVWVYSPGEVDLNGVKLSSRLCALFDSLGNGVVYDDGMRKRLVYNQKEGILMDSVHGLPVTWKWHDIRFLGSSHSMNEEDERRKLIEAPPKRVISASASNPNEKAEKPKDSESPPKSPSLLSMKLTQSEIDFRETHEHPRYVDTAKINPKKVSPLKPIVLRLNKYLALRIFSQSDISLNFYTETHQTTLQIGVLYNPFDKLKVAQVENSTLEAKKVICQFEDFPPNTRSMLKLKNMLQTLRAS